MKQREMTHKMILRHIEIVEEGLEGSWILDKLEPMYLRFMKPPIVAGWGYLLTSKTQDFEEHKIFRYEVSFAPTVNITFLNVNEEGSSVNSQFKLSIDYLSSFVGKLTISDLLGNSSAYVRLEPRKVGNAR